MANIIDTDTHIAEPREMWQFLEPEWYPRRPVVVEVPSDTAYMTSNHMWLIDGQVYPRTAGKGGMFLVTPMSQEPGQDPPDAKARELTDLDMRLHDMDRLGANLQVVYPTQTQQCRLRCRRELVYPGGAVSDDDGVPRRPSIGKVGT